MANHRAGRPVLERVRWLMWTVTAAFHRAPKDSGYAGFDDRLAQRPGDDLQGPEFPRPHEPRRLNDQWQADTAEGHGHG